MMEKLRLPKRYPSTRQIAEAKIVINRHAPLCVSLLNKILFLFYQPWPPNATPRPHTKTDPGSLSRGPYCIIRKKRKDYSPRSRTTMRTGVPVRPKVCRIWFSRYRW